MACRGNLNIKKNLQWEKPQVQIYNSIILYVFWPTPLSLSERRTYCSLYKITHVFTEEIGRIVSQANCKRWRCGFSMPKKKDDWRSVIPCFIMFSSSQQFHVIWDKTSFNKRTQLFSCLLLMEIDCVTCVNNRPTILIEDYVLTSDRSEKKKLKTNVLPLVMFLLVL